MPVGRQAVEAVDVPTEQQGAPETTVVGGNCSEDGILKCWYAVCVLVCVRNVKGQIERHDGIMFITGNREPALLPHTTDGRQSDLHHRLFSHPVVANTH